MAQITIYLADPIEEKARKASKAQGTSERAEQVSRGLDGAWPKAVLDAAGAAPEFPDLDEIRRGQGRDVPRESPR